MAEIGEAVREFEIKPAAIPVPTKFDPMPTPKPAEPVPA